LVCVNCYLSNKARFFTIARAVKNFPAGQENGMKMTIIQRIYIRKSIGIIYGAGFTVLELIMVLVIVGILATLGLSQYDQFMERTRIVEAKTDILALDMKITNFFNNRRSFPASLADIGGAPLDPWGNPYQYLNIQTTRGRGGVRKDHNLVPINSDFDLYSMGKDGRSVSPLTASHSKDDIIRANNGEYIGLAKDY